MSEQQISKRLLLKGSIAAIISSGLISLANASSGSNGKAQSQKTEKLSTSPGNKASWQTYEEILARIKEPVFKDTTYNIADHGAKPNEDISEILRVLINQCSENGGGTVVIPNNTYYCGPIELKSNTHLHLLDGAVIKFSTDPQKYKNVMTRWEGVECFNYSPLIYAYQQKNIAVTGNGKLDGQATFDNWWSWNNKKATVLQKEDRNKLFAMAENNVPVEQRIFGVGHFLRPNFIQPYECENILIADVTILNSPMWEVHPVRSKNIIVRNLKINTHGPNNDGCDPESCQDVLIENCMFNTGDDCIAIKSGRNNDGRRVNIPSDGIIVRNCKMVDGHGGVVLGSECSGHIRNVFVENCEMDSPHLSRAIRFKNNAVRGGILENVFVRNVKVGQVSEAFLTIDLLYEEGSKGNYPPIVRHVSVQNSTSEAGPRVNFIIDFEGAVIDEIKYENCHFKNLTEPDVISTSGTIILTNTKQEAKRKAESKDQAGKL